MDLVTSLDHVLDSQTENKFQALKILHAKKIKSLMTSIDAQQKEIGKLKVLSKDNRRTQMIQSLKKKLKDQEYVSDVLKEELSKKAELSKEEVNDYVIRKTISGPKRYRPLTREELELQIIELEKKVKVKSSAVGSVKEPSSGPPVASSSANKKTSGGSVAHREESKDDTQYLSKISELQDSLYESQQGCDRRDVTISQLKEEISRLRSVNSQLLVVEEERETIERQYNDLTMRYERVVEELEEALHQVGLHQEEAFQIKSECELELENHLIEIDTLREQYEKSLKQNTQLLKNMAELENLFGRNQRLPLEPSALSSSSVAESKSTGGASAGLQEKLKAANNKIAQLENQLKLSISSSNETATEILSLKSTLREKNNVIRDMKRNMTLVSKLSTTAGASSSSPTHHPSPSAGLAATAQSSSSFEILLGKFTNSLLEYELLTSSSGPGSVAASASRGAVEIRNRLFQFLTETIDALLQQQQQQRRKMATSGTSGSSRSEVQIENLQKFEHVLLSRHPEIGMGDDEDDDDDLNGIKIGK
jgi:hypothetical protein